MNAYHLLYAAALFTTLTCSVYASPTSSVPPAGPFRPTGTVSASGASNLDDLQRQLADKAHKAGAIAFVVDVASGKNKLFGSATLYE